MSATAALFNTPSFRFSPSLTSRHKSQKPISLLGLPTSKPFFIGGFASSRPGFERFRRPMTEVSRSDAFRCSDDDVESNGFMEEEAILTNGSSEFRRDFCSGGLESALNRSSKWLVAALFAAFLVWKHDAEAMWIAMGSVVNSWSSTSLKQILNQQRPVSALRSDPGMPSSHAQSIFYTAVFAVLSQFKWLGVNAFSVTVGAFALACGSYLVRPMA
eukprot:TRINITY_DN2849_c0_g1_i3.p1 TRINITY_DN2849_c0_g1~~TRINITY_DN2849_c0_g1_i3.p1  ORF type:complete len:216 (-),score=36.18 TRINITY_DN2849_c0_g1_i3:253-900(-)